MEIFKGQNIIAFGKAFPTDQSCATYLADLKRQDGFICMKSGHHLACRKACHTYHCYRCRYV